MGKVVTLMNERFIVQYDHLYKDTYFTGEYLAKKLGKEHQLVCVYSTLNEDECGDKNILSLITRLETVTTNEIVSKKSTRFNRAILREYLKANAKSIDVLVVFSCRVSTARIIKWFKKYNKNGKVYLKFDSSSLKKSKSSLPIRMAQKFYYHRIIAKKTDVFSIETKKAFEEALQFGMFGKDIKDKLTFVPNGIEQAADSEILSENEKENLIITVGRIGTEDKNNEMFIEALKKLDLQDWKVKLIGPVKESFRYYFEKCQEECPHIKNNVELVGQITDKKLLNQYYRNAKIFVLTSRSENFSLVLCEALRFCDYIVSTDVGAAEFCCDNGRFGKVIRSEDIDALTEALKNVMNGNTLNEDFYRNVNIFKTRFYWENVIEPVAEKLNSRKK